MCCVSDTPRQGIKTWNQPINLIAHVADAADTAADAAADADVTAAGNGDAFLSVM